ncbi:MAG: DMT family transporter [Hyphomicrobiales bacterium]
MNRNTRGWIDGLTGIIIFSGSLPATRLAVAGLDPLFLTAARATIAGVLAGSALLLLRAEWPKRHDLGPLVAIALGVVVGFPLFTALALTRVTAAHSTVFLGLLPLATAVFGVVRGGERPRPLFWLFATIGSGLVAGFAMTAGVAADPVGDILLLVAIVVCGFGYAEGAKQTRRLGGWQVICWALVVSLPVMAPLALVTVPAAPQAVGLTAWAGLGYVSLFSMLIGFIFWYRGLAAGGIAAVGQLQLLQPLLGLGLAAALLGEHVSPAMLVVTSGVLCVAGARHFARQPLAPVPMTAAPGTADPNPAQ